MRKTLFFLLVTFLAVNAHSQLTIDNATFFISPGATVVVQGDVTSNVSIQGTGVLQAKGTALQNINMGGNTIPNLEIDNANNVNLTSAAIIGNSLAFTSGKLLINGFDLRMASAATITGVSNARYVVTNGTGRFIKNSLTGAAYLFPVGFSTTEFNPVSITNSGTADDIGVRCLQNVLANGLSGSAVTTDFANNSWVISEGVAGGSTLALTTEWAASDELAGFNRLKSGIARYNSGTDWDLPASNVIPASGSGPYSLTRNGINAVGVFAVADLDRVNAARLNLKVFLQGNYNSGTGLMTDLLRDDPGTGPVDPVIPTTQPYSAALNARYTRVGVYDGSASVNETVNPAVFNVTGNNAIVDWVYVSSLDPVTPATKLQTRAALLQRDGDIVDLDGVSPLLMPIDADGNYHFLVSHRNHLTVRTPAVQALADNVTLAYNFTDAQAKAFQNGGIATNAAMGVNGAVFVMWAGNASLDDYTRVTTSVVPAIPSDAAYILGTVLGGNPNGTVTGYSTGDLNLDRRARATTSVVPAIPSDVAFILGTVLGGNNNATRREHK